MPQVLGGAYVLIGLGFLALARKVHQHTSEMRSSATTQPETRQFMEGLVRNSLRLRWVCSLAGVCYVIMGVLYIVLKP